MKTNLVLIFYFILFAINSDLHGKPINDKKSFTIFDSTKIDSKVTCNKYYIEFGTNTIISRPQKNTSHTTGNIKSKYGGELEFGILKESNKKLFHFSINLSNVNLKNEIYSGSLGGGKKYDAGFNLFFTRLKLGIGFILLKNRLHLIFDTYYAIKTLEFSKGTIEYSSINTPMNILNLNGKSNEYKINEFGLSSTLSFIPSEKQPFYFSLSLAYTINSTMHFYDYSNSGNLIPSLRFGVNF